MSVIVAHRRAGKTEIVCVKLLLEALMTKKQYPRPLFAYLAPYLNQAKEIAWNRLKFYALQVPGSKIKESELEIILFNGSKIKIFGADNPDRLRGLGLNGVILDEVAQMKEDTWPAVVRPALADRMGWAIFIGTPKGMNYFYELYRNALKNNDLWFAALYTANDTKVIDKKELEAIKQEIGDTLFRQEFMCDFTAANFNSFIDFHLIKSACEKKIDINQDAPLVFGLDPARFGNDKTVLVQRRGNILEHIDSWHGLDLMESAEKVAKTINEKQPKGIFIDAVGLGAGLVDRLRQKGFKIFAIHSGGKAIKSNKYINLKAEMWDKMRIWLQDGASIPDDKQLKSDLMAPSYDYDNLGRLKIESKEDIKKKGKASPDAADALALTFAAQIAGSNFKEIRSKFAKM